MKSKEIEHLVHGWASEVTEGTDIDVLDVQFAREGRDDYLRVYITKDEGVSLTDCEFVSKGIGGKLDETDPIKGSYTLQVSSSGEMPLRDTDDYRKFLGRYAHVDTFAAVNGKKSLEGTIEAVNDGVLVLKDDNGDINIPIDKISRSRLAVPPAY